MTITGWTEVKTVRYAYDPVGNRVAEDVQVGTSEHEAWTYGYDGDRLRLRWYSADGGSDGAFDRRYMYGLGEDEVIGTIYTDDDWMPRADWYLTDQLGSVRTVLRRTGSNVDVRGQFSYTAYGEVSADSWSDSTDEPGGDPVYGSKALNEDYTFGHAGREYDWESSYAVTVGGALVGGLYYNHARWYDAHQRRFISQDPSGLAGGDENLYRYAGNDPINRVDPTGLCASSLGSGWGATSFLGNMSLGSAGMYSSPASGSYTGGPGFANRPLTDEQSLIVQGISGMQTQAPWSISLTSPARPDFRTGYMSNSDRSSGQNAAFWDARLDVPSYSAVPGSWDEFRDYMESDSVREVCRKSFNRLMGGINVLGSVVEGAGGVTIAGGGTFVTAGFGAPVAIAVGGLVTAHAADLFWASAKQIWTGEQQETVTSQLIDKHAPPECAPMWKFAANGIPMTIGGAGFSELLRVRSVNPIGKYASGEAFNYPQLRAAEGVATPEFSGAAAPWKTGATPNSIYRQLTVDGRVKTIGYYDEVGNLFSREDYIQAARHRVTFENGAYDLSKYPHEHQTRTLQGPNGPYLKNQVRILDSSGIPRTEWVNEAP